MPNNTRVSLSLRKPIRSALSTFVEIFPCILIFEVLYKIFTAVVFRPLISGILQLMIRISGERMVFNTDIKSFFLSIPGVIAVLLITALSVIIVYYEFSVIILLAYHAPQEGRVRLPDMMKLGFLSFRPLKNTGVLGFSLYSLILLPVVNIGLTSSLLPSLHIPNYITGELTKTTLGVIGAVAGTALLFVLFLFTIFVLPAMVVERVSFWKGLKYSAKVFRQYRVKIIVVLLVFFATWAFLFLAPRAIFEHFFSAPSVSVIDIFQTYGFSWLTFGLLLLSLFSWLAGICLMPLLMTILVSFFPFSKEYWEYDEDALLQMEAKLGRTRHKLYSVYLTNKGRLERLLKRLRRSRFGRTIKKYRLIIGVVFLLLIGFVGGKLLEPIPRVHEPIVVGHRGSLEGVENTLPAIQGAIDAGADYVEIDILLSSDGVPMVIHDQNLKRLTGQNKNVYDLTAAELELLTLKQRGYTGNIPTLAEVIEYCEGKILLAIELKTHGRETTDLVDRVMAEVKKSSYQKNCMFLSQKYELVERLKENYGDYTAGYCVFGGIGQIKSSQLKKLNIDFLLVEEWMASRSLVNEGKKAGVAIYVWTVNNAESLKSYLKMGALGFITDYPQMGRTLVDDYENSQGTA